MFSPESKILMAGMIMSVLSFVPYYSVLKLDRFTITDSRHVRIFFFIWVMAFLFEYYFLGPYSFIELSHEGNLNIVMNHLLAQSHDGARFTHLLGGGQDIYSVLPGMQYINPELLLAGVLPTWMVILAHKLLIAALGFWGAYLLARKTAPNNRAVSVAVAAVFPVSHEYLLNFSTNWGPGFAALPLAIYICVACSRDKYFYYWILLVGLVLSAAEPIHVFPPLAMAIIGYAILHNDFDLKRVVIGFGVFVFFSLLSWHEFLYANVLGAENTSRAVYTSSNFAGEIVRAIKYFIINWVSAFLYVAGTLVLVIRKDRLALRALIVLAVLILAYAFAQTFPWSDMGLSFMNKVSYHYMLIAMTVLFIPVAARALVLLVSCRRSFVARPEIIVLAFGLALLSWNKFLNFGLLTWFGGQSAYSNYQPLKNPQWNPNRNFRVITMFATPPANITAGFYGFDSFDGTTNLRSIAWSKYWFEIMYRDPSYILATRTGIKWSLWNGKTYDIEKYMRLDLLQIANVRYLFSALPLASKNLRLISNSRRKDWAKVRPSFFASYQEFLRYRFKRIFDPGTLYVYELLSPLKRVYAATDVVYDARVDFAKTALSGAAMIDRKYRADFEGLGKLRVFSFMKVTDGFDVTVQAPNGGALVVNNVFSRFWEASADGKSLKIVPANKIHMAVAVPPGVKNIKIRYRRPLLRERLMRLIS